MRKKPTQSNPFVQSLVIRGRWTLNIDRKGQSEASVVATSYLVEVDKKVTVYTEHIGELFRDLDRSGMRLFAYVCEHMRYNQDYLQLDCEKVCASLQISRATYYNALQSLQNKVLVKRDSATYFVNPMYIFFGNRMDKYTANTVLVNKDPLKEVLNTPMTFGEDVDQLAITGIPGTDWKRQPHVPET
jgi:predicted DNA-binding protein (UPF0251 family)